MKRLFVFIILMLSLEAGKAQRVLSDRIKDEVRAIELSGKTFDIHMRSHKVSLTGCVQNGHTYYMIKVYTYVDIPENSQLIFTSFNHEEVVLSAVNKSNGYVVMIPSFGSMMPVIPFSNYTASYLITIEQLNKIFASGINAMKISAGINSRERTWKKDKLGIFLKKSYDKLQMRLGK